jgi:hypothetical protein
MNKKIKTILHNPALLFLTLGQRGWFNWISDETYLRIAYFIKTGKRLHLNPPVTFNEKLQWLKLHDRRPEYTMMVDKYEAKRYVAEKIGEEHIIPTYGVWEKFEDIDFSQLPNQFVLKCTHDSGGLVICKDKNAFDKDKARKKINSCLKHNFYWGQREWPYKNVKPRIIAEKYMTDDGDELQDYKVHNFNGVPKVVLVCRDRFKEAGLTEDFFTGEWKHLDVKRPEHPNAETASKQPERLKDMLTMAAQLSARIPFVRTDFYEVNGEIYFGELTFFPSSGFGGFDPKDFNERFGSWIVLSDEMGGDFKKT